MKIIPVLIVSLFFFITVLNATIINVPADYTTIQSGINTTINGDTVLVQPGTYIENINFNGKNIVVGSMFLISGDTCYISQTVIDGNQNGSVVTFENWEDSTAILTGFTITNGYSTHGGGIWCEFSSPCIRYNIISGNQALQGGGIKCSASNLRIEHNLISWNSNWAGQISAGGGIYVWQSDVIILGNKFANNHSERHGGAIHLEQSTSLIINNIITENTSGEMGGGICCYVASTGNIVNNLICNNNAMFGGGIYLNEVPYQLMNNTICDNSAENGGGILCVNDVIILLKNSILWDNTANGAGSQVYMSSCLADFNYCDILDGESGFYIGENVTYTYEDNLELDPQFLGTGEHPYSLSEESECVNAGSPDTIGLYLPEIDLAGNSRVVGDCIDLGAYEWQEIVYIGDEIQLTKELLLSQNYPNPFNSFSTISYVLNKPCFLTLNIYDQQGRKVKCLVNEFQMAKTWSVVFDGNELNEGIYFYSLEVGNQIYGTKKMILMR